MVRRGITQLAIYQSEVVERLPLRDLQNFYLQKTSETIYITNKGKLFGIVCMGEALNPDQNGEVKVNRSFTKLIGYNVIRAHEIFKCKPKIHMIPVVNEEGELLGDYSRWDDMLYVERTQSILMGEQSLRGILSPYKEVYIVEPADKENLQFINFIKYLQEYKIAYKQLRKEEIGEKRLEKSICVFLDEDEKRGMQCYYGIRPLSYDALGYDITRHDMLVNDGWNLRLATYKSLLLQIQEELQLQKLSINKPENLLVHRLDDKATIFLSELEKKGIKCFYLYHYEDKISEYGKNFRKEINERQKKLPISLKKPWIKRTDNEEFYGELYSNEDYADETAQKEIHETIQKFEIRKNVTGKYFNAQSGRRVTCFQPDTYTGTIYLLGLCTMVGLYVEDQYTIASWLQKKLLEKGYVYRVENYGTMLRNDASIESKLNEIEAYTQKDIVIYLSLGKLTGIQGESLEHIFEEHNITSRWVTDMYGHCNHKANELIAEGILKMIGTCLHK